MWSTSTSLAPGPTLTALTLGGYPLVGTFHRAGPSGWVRAFRRLSIWAANHLNLRVAVSEEAMATARNQIGGTYEMVWNGIEVASYQAADPWPSQGPTVMFIGRHEPRKGLAVLLEAMGSLGSDVRLWVASNGPDTDVLQQASAEDPRIEWLGLIGEREKIRRIRGADVLCAPSLHGESFGVVLLEGLAAGTAVVASDLVGYSSVARPRAATLCSPRPATPRLWPWGSSGPSPEAPRSNACSRAGSNGPPPSPWSAWPPATSSCSKRSWRAEPAHSDGPGRARKPEVRERVAPAVIRSEPFMSTTEQTRRAACGGRAEARR